MDQAYLAALLAFLTAAFVLLNSIGFLSFPWRVGLLSLFLFASSVPVVIKTITFLISPHRRRSLLLEALLEMLTSDYYEDLCFFLWKHRLHINCNYPNKRKVFYTDSFKLYVDWGEQVPNSVDLRVDRVALHFHLKDGKKEMIITDDVQSKLDSYSSIGVFSVNVRKELEEAEIAISYVPERQTIKWTIRGDNMKREHHYILSCDSRMFMNATHILENLSNKGIVSPNTKVRRGCLVFHNVHMLKIWDCLNNLEGRICDAGILTEGKKCLIESRHLFDDGNSTRHNSLIWDVISGSYFSLLARLSAGFSRNNVLSLYPLLKLTLWQLVSMVKKLFGTEKFGRTRCATARSNAAAE